MVYLLIMVLAAGLDIAVVSLDWMFVGLLFYAGCLRFVDFGCLGSVVGYCLVVCVGCISGFYLFWCLRAMCYDF